MDLLNQLNIYGLSLDVKYIQVSDCNGKKLKFTMEKNQSIDVSKLRPGVYFLDIKMINGHSFSTRFVKF